MVWLGAESSPMSREELSLLRTTAKWKLPARAQSRLDDLLDRKPDLSKHEIRELDALIAVNDQLSLIKARAMRILRQKGERIA